MNDLSHSDVFGKSAGANDLVPLVFQGYAGKTYNYYFIKRLMDLFIATAMAIFLFPVLLFISILVLGTTRGWAIFRQKRIGFGGQEFYCWKFRTMYHDAEQRLTELLENDVRFAHEWEQTQKLKSDPRITLIGRVLRKSSLDELPQLWNIIKGEMSLVGPRPIVNSEVEKYGYYFNAYISVPPGVTGLWQVSGRNDTTYEERVLLDATYATETSILTDIKILLRTIPAVLLGRGAY